MSVTVASARVQPLVISWLPALLLLTLLFNLVDIALTLGVVSSGLAVEANPLMAALLRHSPQLFVLGKFSLVCPGLAVLWHYRGRVLAQVGTLSVFTVYAMLMAYHVQSVQLLLQ